MALTKINYVSGKTVITAENLNDIQDAVLDLERKGGVGMGITGATVGQIAKITAVDGNGVPAAWEPVDMPSGGGGENEEWELVFTETVAEDATSYSRNVDSNGEPFALDEVALIILTVPFAESENNAGRQIGMVPDSRWGYATLSSISDSIKRGTSDIAQYDVIHAKVINGYQICLSSARSQNKTSAFGTMMPVTTATAALGVHFFSDQTKFMQINRPQGNFTCVKIVGYTNPLISAGSIISLYKRKGA